MQVVDKTSASILCDFLNGLIVGDMLTKEQKLKLLMDFKKSSKVEGETAVFTMTNGGTISIDGDGKACPF